MNECQTKISTKIHHLLIADRSGSLPVSIPVSRMRFDRKFHRLPDLCCLSIDTGRIAVYKEYGFAGAGDDFVVRILQSLTELFSVPTVSGSGDQEPLHFAVAQSQETPPAL